MLKRLNRPATKRDWLIGAIIIVVGTAAVQFLMT